MRVAGGAVRHGHQRVEGVGLDRLMPAVSPGSPEHLVDQRLQYRIEGRPRLGVRVEPSSNLRVEAVSNEVVLVQYVNPVPPSQLETPIPVAGDPQVPVVTMDRHLSSEGGPKRVLAEPRGGVVDDRDLERSPGAGLVEDAADGLREVVAVRLPRGNHHRPERSGGIRGEGSD